MSGNNLPEQKFIDLSARISLQKFLEGPVIKGDPVMSELLVDSDQWSNCALGIIDFYHHTIFHASENLESILGVPRIQFMKEGLPGIVKRTHPDDLPCLVAQQGLLTQTMQQNNYNHESALIQHFKWTTLCPSGEARSIQSLSIVLTFNEYKEWEAGIGFYLRNDSGQDEVVQKCREFLIKLKDRHNMIYQHRNGQHTDLPYLIQYTDTKQLSITRREREVLKYLAVGFSTRKIAEQLTISLHTVESHRKNLLEKFEAKNSVELIKKASKVFWFD